MATDKTRVCGRSVYDSDRSTHGQGVGHEREWDMKVKGDVTPKLAAFTFEEGGRTYECTPENRGDPSRGSWWWFTVSNDSQRYARFEAVAGDTRSSVRARIVAYYEHRLWARAQPVVRGKRFGRPAKPPAPPAVPEKG